MESVAIVLFLAMIIAGFLFSRNKLVTVIMMIYIWIIIALNTASPDYASYEMIYKDPFSVYSVSTEIGYRMMGVLFSSLGFSYAQFRMVLATIYVFLLANYIFRATTNRNIVFALMLISPTILDISGIRSAIAYLIVMNFSLLLRNKTRKNTALFLLGVALSCTFHTSAVFYIVLLMMDKKWTQRSVIRWICVLLVVAVVLYSPLIKLIANALYAVTGYAKVLKWIGNETIKPNLTGIFSVAIFEIMYAVMATYENKYIVKKEGRTTKHYANINVMYILLMALNVIATESRRLMCGSLIIKHSLTANTVGTESHRINRKALIYLSVQILITALQLWMYTYSYKSHDVFETLYKNMIFGG